MYRHLNLIFIHLDNESHLKRINQNAEDTFRSSIRQIVRVSQKLICLIIQSRNKIKDGTIRQFGYQSFIGDGTYLVHLQYFNLGEDSNISKKDNNQAVSFAVELSFNFFEVVFLKRLFFVLNLKRLLKANKQTTTFYTTDDYLFFSLQSPDPILDTVIDFLEKTIKATGFSYLKSIF